MSSDWKSDIENSKYFLVLATDIYFSKKLAKEHVEYANRLNKPFRILLHEEAEIPEGFFDGVKNIKYSVFGKNRSLQEAVSTLLKHDDIFPDASIAFGQID